MSRVPVGNSPMDITTLLRAEKAKHAIIGHRPREYAQQLDAALAKIDEQAAQLAAHADPHEIAGEVRFANTLLDDTVRENVFLRASLARLVCGCGVRDKSVISTDHALTCAFRREIEQCAPL